MLERGAGVKTFGPRIVLATVFAALWVLGACGGDPAPESEGVRPVATATIQYRMAAVKTSTPAVTPTPVAPTATATWVPLPSPSPTAADGPLTAGDVPRLGVAQARERAAAGEAVFVDVRSAATYQKSHIAGAISLPGNEVAGRVGELPADKVLIFY